MWGVKDYVYIKKVNLTCPFEHINMCECPRLSLLLADYSIEISNAFIHH